MKKLNLSDRSVAPEEISVDSSVLVTDNDNSSMKKSQKSFYVFAFIAVLLGVGTGFGAFRMSAKSSLSNSEVAHPTVAEGSIKSGDIFGSNDDSFKDSAKGYLEEGDLDDEGSHRLLRPGGASQTVYLTSSVTDLSKLEGMEVEVWGETFKGQKVGWLMDVGKIKVIEPKGTPPEE